MADYEGVPERLVKFFADHPEGSVQVEVELFDPETDTALMRAHLYRAPDDQRPGIGVAMERASHTPTEIMTEGFVEAAGTHAVGKALENLGYAKKLVAGAAGGGNGNKRKAQEPSPQREKPKQIKNLTETEKKVMEVDALVKAREKFITLAPDGSGEKAFLAVLGKFQATSIEDVYVSAIGNVRKLLLKDYKDLVERLEELAKEKEAE